MIPLTLTLKNFMSYGAEPVTLPLEGLHVVCLSGDNGNGKSALLDALTWALWGKTRASSVKSISEDDLIRMGADEVEVRCEFALNAQRYRVTRKRRRGKSGGQWELAQWNESGGGYVPVGGGSMRETEKQITQLLCMEYDTFLNSAYLQQGRADEFTRQTPDNRKRILGEILGLDRYDRLEAKARERAKDNREIADELARDLNALQAQIATLPGHLAQQEEAQQARACLEEKLAEQEKAANALREQRAKLDALAGTAAEADNACLRLENDVQDRLAEKQAKAARIEELRRILSQRDAVLKDYQELENRRKERDQLEPDVEAFNRASSEKQNVVGAINIEEVRLKGELKGLEAELRSAEQRAQERCQLEARLKAVTEELKASGDVGGELNAARERMQALQGEFAELSARNKELTAAIEEVEEVLELLARPQAQCPVCDSDLSGAKQQAVLARQQQKCERFKQEQKTVRADGTAKKQAVNALQAEIERLNAQHLDLTAKRTRQQEMQAQFKALSAEGANADALRKQAEALHVRLEKGDYAVPQRIKLQRLTDEIQRLGLAKVAHEKAMQQIARLEPVHKRYEQVKLAEGSLPAEMAEQERLEQAIAEKRREVEAARKRRDELKAQLGEYGRVQQEAARAEAELKQMQQELSQVQMTLAAVASYIAQCRNADAEHQQKNALHQRADEQRRMYNALTQAFGKKGIQTYIIENAIPELEEEANGLLARMTDNAMQVNFETTRLAKGSGNEIETLDIKITDDSGARPYELYSGGEAFRVNFAIRIALSRLLARRAGAKLQTLILDEGFGTQDGKGREKLVEVIDAIKEDFERILVITHVEELKDAFPQRIEVTKDARGSRIHVL